MFSVKASGLQRLSWEYPTAREEMPSPQRGLLLHSHPQPDRGLCKHRARARHRPSPQDNGHAHTQWPTVAPSCSHASLHTLCDGLCDSIREAGHKHVPGVKDVGIHQHAIAFLLLGATVAVGPWGQTLPSPFARVFFWGSGVSTGHWIQC